MASRFSEQRIDRPAPPHMDTFATEMFEQGSLCATRVEKRVCEDSQTVGVEVAGGE
jgi:hypothetical protein